MLKKTNDIQSSNEIKTNFSNDEVVTKLLTSSFIHEFRNPLTVIQGFVQLLRSGYPDLPYLDIILKELDGLKKQTTQFLLLPNHEIMENEKSVINIKSLFEQIDIIILPRILEFKVQLMKEIHEDLFINGYRQELIQVLINLLFNAMEAMVDQVGVSKINIYGYSKEGFTIIEIANCGPKIPETMVNEIFEPFITTKSSGTGLGLYISKKIIEKHHGELFCTSNDENTVFTIKLPMIKRNFNQ